MADHHEQPRAVDLMSTHVQLRQRPVAEKIKGRGKAGVQGRVTIRFCKSSRIMDGMPSEKNTTEIC